MGGKHGVVSSVTKAVSSAVPKITVGDPTKLITKPIEGLVNAAATIDKSVIGGAASVAGAAVGGVGQVMSQPGAGAVLGAAGAAFGVPEAGMLAGALGGMGGASVMGPSSAPVLGPQMYSADPVTSGGMGISKNVLIGAAIGGLLLIMIIFLAMRRKR